MLEMMIRLRTLVCLHTSSVLLFWTLQGRSAMLTECRPDRLGNEHSNCNARSGHAKHGAFTHAFQCRGMTGERNECEATLNIALTFSSVTRSGVTRSVRLQDGQFGRLAGQIIYVRCCTAVHSSFQQCRTVHDCYCLCSKTPDIRPIRAASGRCLYA